MEADATEEALRVERLSTVHRQMPLTLATTLLIALLTAAVLARRTPGALLLGWVGATTALVVLRFAWWFRTSPRAVIGPAVWRWEAQTVLGSAASGALWGACSVFLIPGQERYALFVAFVVAGMCAGSITVNAAHPPSVLAFIVPASLPLALWFAMRGTALYSIMAAMMIVFTGALLLATHRFAEFFSGSVRTRIELAARTDALADANERLRMEIIEHKATEAALRHSQKLETIGSLSSGIAHDFNNVLMVIRGTAEILLAQVAADASRAALLSKIVGATERGANLARQLLTFARKQSPEPAVVEVGAVLRDIATLLAPTLGRTLRFEVRSDPAQLAVLIDRNELEHALVNLAINARDAMPAGGLLTFGTAIETLSDADGLAPGEYVAICVGDTGTGMTAEVLRRALDPFFTTKKPGQGSGLGLSRVHALTKRYGGTVRIESAPGTGTTVRLILPRARQEAGGECAADPRTTEVSSSPDLPTSTGIHVVLLDNDRLARETIAELLHDSGYRVSAFAMAAEAVRCIEGDASVALLITDIEMPDQTGDEVERRVHRLRPSLPVFFITGYDEPHATRQRSQLRKPFSKDELVAVIETALQPTSGGSAL